MGSTIPNDIWVWPGMFSFGHFDRKYLENWSILWRSVTEYLRFVVVKFAAYSDPIDQYIGIKGNQ